MMRVATVDTDFKNVATRKRVAPSTDYWLVAALLALLAIGMVLVFSASVTLAEAKYHDPLHFLYRHLMFTAVGVGLGLVAASLPLSRWQALAPMLLMIAVVLLIAVLIPDIGHKANGSRRWIGFAGMYFQPSEIMKLSMVIFMAAYLARHADAVRTSLQGFGKPLVLLVVIAGLLMIEPDFGSTAVLAATVLSLLFLAGMRLWPFALLAGVIGTGLVTLALTAPYRLERLTSFMNPWADPFNSGFQLTQALIAFGRGGWFGVGLGGSVQKLNYLPEAHTDFVFAILAEEMGLIGSMLVIGLFALVIARAWMIAARAEHSGNAFAAYLAYGVALWLGLQALVNIGVNMGVLPTKGLTLPLLSYGGSSQVITLVACALLLRVDYDTRDARRGRAHV